MNEIHISFNLFFILELRGSNFLFFGNFSYKQLSKNFKIGHNLLVENLFSEKKNIIVKPIAFSLHSEKVKYKT